MSPNISASFLFRFSLPVRKLAEKYPPTAELPASCAVPWPAELNGERALQPELRIGWNTSGLAIQLRVEAKLGKQTSQRFFLDEADGFQVWIDTRNMQSIHRAGRYCQSYALHPSFGGPSGDAPIAVATSIARARDDAKVGDASKIQLKAKVESKSWQLQAWLPESALFGFDPVSSPNLGFYCAVRSRRVSYPFSFGPEFPYSNDPSLWSTLQLSDVEAG